MAFIVAFYLLNMGMAGVVTSQCLQGSDVNISTATFPATEDLLYVAPQQSLQYVIVPEMKFSCYGNITSWSALTVVDSTDSFLSNLDYWITFTLWRPRPGNTGYDLVGTNLVSFENLQVDPIDNSTGLAPLRYSYFRFMGRVPARTTISFQPGDVVGWTVERSLVDLTTINAPVSVVYRRANSQDPHSFDIKYMSAMNNTRDTACSLGGCEEFTTAESVVPYVTVHYVETSSEQAATNNFNCFDRGEVCPTDPPAEIPSSQTPCVGLDCPTHSRSSTESGGISTFYYIIGGAVGGVVILSVLVILTLLFLCFARLKRTLKNDSFEDNPTYESADHIFHECGPGQRIIIPMADLDPYATPADVQVSFKPSKVPTEVECYASTYSSNNGEAHLYQELNHTSKAVGPPPMPSGGVSRMGSLDRCNTKPVLPDRQLPASRTRAYTMSLSREAVGPRRHEPFRNALSFSSRFSETNIPVASGAPPLPQAQPPPYTEVVKTPRQQQQGGGEKPGPNMYLEARPSVASMISLPAMRSRPLHSTSSRFMTSLQGIPDEIPTPVGMDGIQSHKLFHAKDDDVFRVPTLEERMEFGNLHSTDQVYSRLKFPKCKAKWGSVDQVNSAPFWMPSSSTELYDELAKKNYREIHRNYIKTTQYIGGGHFGTVHSGFQRVPGGEVPVAIKTLNPNSSSADKIKFLQEAAIMGQFLHTNIVKLLGVVTVGEPMMIVLELMPKGDLSRYLGTLRCLPEDTYEDLPMLFLGFCQQIGFGMNYLASKGFVHRDLAARNVLLADDLMCKIGDFGLARGLEKDEVYVSQGGKMPIKWTAPEAIKHYHFSSASDVWSYGMLLYEIWSLGRSPFEGTAVKRVCELVSSGYCQPPPPGCPRAIYKLMVQCWNTSPEDRPDFSNICTYLNTSSSEALLQWNSSDLNTSPRAAKVGAPLSDAKDLFLDLQDTYNTV